MEEYKKLENEELLRLINYIRKAKKLISIFDDEIDRINDILEDYEIDGIMSRYTSIMIELVYRESNIRDEIKRREIKIENLEDLINLGII